MHELNVDPKILCLLKVAMYQHEGNFILLQFKVILNLSRCFSEKIAIFRVGKVSMESYFKVIQDDLRS